MDNFESWTTELVSNLASHFDLAGWTMTVEFSDSPKGDSYAENCINTAYQRSEITVYPGARKDFEKGDTERLMLALVHEVIHVFVDPFHESMLPFLSPSSTPSFMNILEQQTQKLTMIFMKTIPKSLIPPR